MSEIQGTVPFVPETKIRIPKKKRLTYIIQYLRKGATLPYIAGECGVSEKTIDRDLKEWRESGGYDTWLNCELLILHDAAVEEDIIAAYRVVADLWKERMRKKTEIELSGKMEVEHGKDIAKLLEQYKPLLDRLQQSNISQNTVTEPVDSTSTNTQTS